MKRFFLFNLSMRTRCTLVLLLALFLGVMQAQDEDPVVIRLGDTTVTQSEFDARFRVAIYSLAMQQGMPGSPELLAQFDSLRPQYLEELAMQIVLLDEAQRRGITAPEDVVDDQLAEMRARFESEEAFTAALGQAGFADEVQLRQMVDETSVIRELVTALQEEITVSEEELEAWYEENQEEFTQPEEVCARHILVATLEEAQEIAQELEAGEDFAALAEEHSTDPGSAAQGGDLNCLPRGVTVPEFEAAAFATPLDTVSEPVETQFGYHLILPYERREASVQTFEEVSEQVRQQVEQQRLNEEITVLREQAEIEIFAENLLPATDPTDADPTDTDPDDTEPDTDPDDTDTE